MWDLTSRSALRKSSGLSVAQANEITGGLSNCSKLPCKAFSLPASSCKTGGRLRKNPKSVCHSCYAADTVDWLKERTLATHGGGRLRWNRYAQKTVRTAMDRRLAGINHKMWVPAISFLILWYEHPSWGSGKFRWFDSGDIQSRRNYRRILAVCRKTEPVRHWMPTKEYRWLEWDNLPANLCQRVSMPVVHQKPPKAFVKQSVTTSTVDSDHGRKCPAYSQGNMCLQCDACWNPQVLNIDYRRH